MEQLILEMKKLQASVFALYLKSHGFHWNIMGANFPQYHSFLDDMYNAVHDSVDGIAEQIRQLGTFAPASLTRFQELTLVDDELAIPDPAAMFAKLRADNATVMGQLNTCCKLADSNNEIGLSNFLQDRMMYHKKLGWMLSSIGGVQQA